MSEKTLRICHLYPDLLNLYGDRGYILCMRRRLEWRGIGVEVTEGETTLTVAGRAGRPLTGGTVSGANDHRIVMAAAVAATACAGSVTVLGAEAVHKSYPDFFTVYQALGGAFHVL